MHFKFPFRLMSASFASLCLLLSVHAAGKPEDEFVRTVQLLLGKDFANDWRGIERLAQVKWAPLPPTMLQNCLPDGGCFTRTGAATIGGRNLGVMATGARTFVSNIYFRNTTAPFGEAAVVAALKQAALSADLARCPVKAGTGSTNWYRLKGATTHPGYLSIQSSCEGRPCEGFVLSLSEKLPPLQPNQLPLYSEQCSAAAGERKPVSTVMPHEQLAQTIVALMPPASSPAFYDWKTLTSQPTGIKWHADGAKKGDLSYKGDPNPWMHQGEIAFSGRQFYLVFGGSPTQVKTIYMQEGLMHPRGEDLLGLLRSQGFTVQLARCGPVYTQSTDNWYNVTSAKTRPVMLKQSLRFEGKQVQDTYELRLDATLPKRDPRDRDPGVGGCK